MVINDIKVENGLGLYCKNGKEVLVGSRKIAETFEKRHDDIKKIRNIKKYK